MSEKLETIRKAVSDLGTWKVSSYSGEHDETGGNITDVISDKFIAHTSPAYNFRDSKNQIDWEKYHQTTNFIADSPEYVRYLIAVIDKMGSNALADIAEGL